MFFINSLERATLMTVGLVFAWIGYKMFIFGVDKGQEKLKNLPGKLRWILSGTVPGLSMIVAGVATVGLATWMALRPLPASTAHAPQGDLLQSLSTMLAGQSVEQYALPGSEPELELEAVPGSEPKPDAQAGSAPPAQAQPLVGSDLGLSSLTDVLSQYQQLLKELEEDAY